MADSYEIKKTHAVSPMLSFGKLNVIVVAVIFLQSLIIAWSLFLLTGGYNEALPLFRLMLGIAILFAVFIPVFILLEGFRYSSIMAGFFIPLFVYTLMFPLFNSLVRQTNLFLDPAIILPAIIGGIGFGLIGLGAYHMRTGVSKTFALVTAGITIIFLSSPTILGIFLFVLTGDLTSFPALLS